MVSTLLALELERARSPEWASEEAAAGFVRDVLARKVTDRGDILARAAELGADLEGGAGVLIAARRAARRADRRVAGARADPGVRALRSAAPGSLAALEDGDAGRGRRRSSPPRTRSGSARAADGAGAGAGREPARVSPRRSGAAAAPPTRSTSTGPATRRGWRSTSARPRAMPLLAFEDTGAYRLLLPAMSEDAGRAGALLRGDDRAAGRLRRAVRDRAGGDDRGLPRERRQRRRDRQAPVHPPAHDSLPARAGEGAVRPRRLLDRGPREARASG